MERQDLEKLAKKIAEAEYIIQTSNDENEVREAQHTIVHFAMQDLSLEDMMLLDDIIQEKYLDF